MSINIDKVEDGLPISVIVPLSKNRYDFFNNFVLPLIEANNPNEIIINDNNGNAPQKRNDGFKKSTQPYVMFLDDDKLIPENMLKTFYNELKSLENKAYNKYGYVYCGYKGIVLHPESHPMKGNFEIKSQEFDGEKLKKGNFIDTTSLINKKFFPFFDEKLKRFQDWDLYLNMYINNDIVGKFNNNIIFYSYYLDKGITSVDNNINDAYNMIREKYKL